MTRDAAIRRVLQIARAEIGYREKSSASGLDDPAANAGSGNYTKYARDLDRIPGFYNGAKQGYAWCDVFYDWIIVHAFGTILGKRLLCQPENSAGAGCLYSAGYYRAAGQFHTAGPQPGDQIFFSYSPGEVSHTGVVESVSGTTVTTIEGNTSDSVGRRSYPISSGTIYGYGRPDWSLLDGVSDADTGFEDETPVSPAPVPDADRLCSVQLPELKQGSTGIAVERLQVLLIARGYYCGGRRYGGREQPDGDFGPATLVAIQDVQLAAHIKQDGVVGPDTWSALITK